MSRIRKPAQQRRGGAFDENSLAHSAGRADRRTGHHEESSQGVRAFDSASSNGPAQLSIPLTASDPSTAVILEWLAKHPPNRTRAALLRAALATGIQVDVALERMEAKLDRLLAGGAISSPSAPAEPRSDETLRPFLDGLFDFTAAEG